MVGVERVHGRGDLVALAIVELELAGVLMTPQGLQVGRLIGNRITVALPTFKNPRNGVMQTVIVLPRELSNAIGASVAHAADTLEEPKLPPDPAHGVKGSAAIL